MVNDLTSLIGHTPILELSGLEGLQARLAVKIEFFNPGGSVKDRIALAMITDAEERGLLTPGATIIEPTSGNTGVGLAWVGAVRGYRVILTMPDTMSVERRNLLKAYGAGYLRPVHQSRQPCYTPPDDRRRNLGGHRRTSGYLRGRRRNRRHRLGCRAGTQST